MSFLPTHMFHFVFTRENRELLKKLSFESGLRPQVFIRHILLYAVPLMESCQYNFTDAKQERQAVWADCDMYIEIPLELMQRIRMLRWQCRVWSCAIIVRIILTGFIELASRRGLAGAWEFLRRYERRFSPKRQKSYHKQPHMLPFADQNLLWSLEIGRNFDVRAIHLLE